MKMVRLDSVSVSYHDTLALDGISLEIEPRERVVVLGPSGCGKTTMLRLLAGFMSPDAGDIFLSGELVATGGRIIKAPEQRHLGLVFQDLALWPHMSVKGNLEFGLKAEGMARDERNRRCAEILALVGMSGYAQRKPNELSGGQQQRVALARALVQEPKVLLMDEPLSSLDQELNVRLQGEILRLQEKLAFTLVYVTHDRREAFGMATRVVVMDKGRLVFAGGVEEARAVYKERDFNKNRSSQRTL